MRRALSVPTLCLLPARVCAFMDWVARLLKAHLD